MYDNLLTAYLKFQSLSSTNNHTFKAIVRSKRYQCSKATEFYLLIHLGNLGKKFKLSVEI